MSSQVRQVFGFRSFYYSTRRCLSSEVQKSNGPVPPSSNTSQTPQDIVDMSTLKKRMFVFAGIYRSVKDAPDRVTRTTMSRNMDKFRVKLSLVIMLLSALGALSSIMLAKGIVEDIEEERDQELAKKQ